MSTLTDRYLAAMIRLIPEPAREDIEDELRTSIVEAVGERVEVGQDPDAAERNVLNGLGDPARLAAEYSKRPLWLIGPRFYLAWLRMMKRLLTIIPSAVGIVTVAVSLAAGEDLLQSLFSGIWVAVVAALNVVLWTTIGFIIAERSNDVSESDIEPLTRWNVDRLPSTHALERLFNPLSTIGGVLLNLILIIILWSMRSISEAPVLDTTAWEIAIPAMIFMLAISSMLKIIKYATGRWTLQLAILNGALNLGYATWWLLALWDFSVLSTSAADALRDNPGILLSARIVAGIIAVVCVWDTVEGFREAKAAKNARRAPYSTIAASSPTH